jgi:hypothetical protein
VYPGSINESGKERPFELTGYTSGPRDPLREGTKYTTFANLGFLNEVCVPDFPAAADSQAALALSAESRVSPACWSMLSSCEVLVASLPFPSAESSVRANLRGHMLPVLDFTSTTLASRLFASHLG